MENMAMNRNYKEQEGVTKFISIISYIYAKTLSFIENVPSNVAVCIPKIMKNMSIMCCQLYLSEWSFFFKERIKNIEFFVILIKVIIKSNELVLELKLRQVQILIARNQMYMINL